MYALSSRSINDSYTAVLSAIMTNGSLVPSRNGNTMEARPVMLDLEDPRRRIITSQGRLVNVAFALAEVLWILQGRDDLEMLKFYNSRMYEWSDDGERFNAAYGKRLRFDHGFDQLDDIVMNLREDPDSRQAILNVWHPSKDRAYLQGQVKNVTADRACNVLAHVIIRNGALHWMQVIRSNDAIWGLPYNIIQWTSLQEYVANRVGVPVGHYTHVADSLHVYEPFWEEAEQVRTFDLYTELGADHAPMLTNGLVLSDVYRMEEEIRRGTSLMLRKALGEPEFSSSLGQYWTSVLKVLLSYRYYKTGENGTCMKILQEIEDPVLALATTKFYWEKRWAAKYPTASHEIVSMVENHTPGGVASADVMAWFGLS